MRNCSTVYTKINFTECAHITVELHIILSTSLSGLHLAQVLHGNITFYGRVLKSIACEELVPKAADKLRIILFSHLSGKIK
jgi:hypothetical protein